MMKITSRTRDKDGRVVSLSDQVREMFTLAGQWRDFDHWELHEDHEKAPADERICSAAQDLFIQQAMEPGSALVDISNYECIVVEIEPWEEPHIRRAINGQVQFTNNKAKYGGEELNAQSVYDYAEHKRNSYPKGQPAQYELLSFDHGKQRYMGIFMHPFIRAVVAADIVQQDTFRQKDGQLYRER